MADPEVRVRITADTDGVVVATGQASESFRKFGRSVKSSQSESLRSLSSFASRVGPEFAKVSAAAVLNIKKDGWRQGLASALRELNVFEGATGRLLDQIRTNVASRLEGIGQAAKTAFQGLTAGAAVGAGAFAVGAVRAAADAQKLQLRLETLARSAGHVADAAEVARSKMAFLEELDKVASSDLPTLTEAGAALEAYRLPMEGFLPLVGDFSAAMGANLEDVSRAVGKAMQGQAEGFEVLGRQGITKQDLFAAGAHRNKDGSMALKGAEDQAAARQALVTILQRYRGGMEAESKSISGAFSMIASSWNLLQRAVAEPFSAAIQSAALAISNFLDRTTGFVKWLEQSGGGIAAWVASAGGMGAAFAALGVVMTSTLVAVGAPMLTFLGTVGKIGLVARTFSFLFGAIAAWAPKLGFLGTVGTWLGGIASKAGLVQGAVIALGATLTTGLLAAFAVVGTVAGAFAVAWWRDWGGIRDKTAAAVEWIRNATVNGFRMLATQAVAIWEGTKVAVVRVLERLEAEMKPAVEAVIAWFEANWPTIQSIVLQTMEIVIGIVNRMGRGLQVAFEWADTNLLPIWSGLWKNVKDQVVLAWQFISTTVSSGLKWIDTAMRVGAEAMRGNWEGAWDAIKVGLERQFDPINVMLRRLIVSLLDTLRDSLPRFNLAGQAIGAAISAGIQNQEQAIARLEDRIALRNARNSVGNQAVHPLLAAFYALGKPPAAAPAEPQTPRTPAFDYEKFLRDFGANQGQDEEPEKSDKGKKSARQTMSDAERVVSEALRQVGGVFEPGNAEQCANWVRDVYRRAGVKLGVTNKPLDHGPVGAALASSFAGADVGQIIIDRSQLRPGDVVTYANTYGRFEEGAITHAGVYAGGGEIVHRPTQSGQVVRAGLDDPGKFAYGIRPYAIAGKDASEESYRALLRWREQVKALGQDHESLAGKLAEVDARFAKMLAEGIALGASRDELEKIEAERQAERSKLMAEQADRERALLAEMSAERLELLGSQAEQERAALDKRFADLVEHWRKVASETPTLAAQAEEQIATVQRAAAAARASLIKSQAREAAAAHRQAWEKQHQQALADHEFRIRMGRETNEGLLAFLAQQLEAWRGTEEGKRALALRYREAFLEDLRVRREAQDAYDLADLDRELAQLQAKTELTVAEEIRRDALLAEVQEVHLTRLAEMRQRAQDVADTLRNSFQQSFVAVLSGQQTLGQGIKGVWDAVKQAFLQAIAEMIIKTQAFQAVLMALKAVMNSIGGIFGGLFGFHTGGVVEASGVPYAVAHTGGLLGPGGALQSFHSGGSVGRVQLGPDEVLAKLQTGEIVLSRDNVRDLGRVGGVPGPASGAPSVNLTVQNLHHHGPQDTQAMARDLGRRMAFYVPGG